MNANDYTIDELHVGDTVSFSRTITNDDVLRFAELSGDKNPLHLDDEYARTTSFGKRLVHGMLLGSLCSQVVGMHLPGKRCLYLKQDLLFKKPAYIDDTISVTGTVVAKSLATSVLTVKIVMKKNEVIVLEGEARVQVLSV